MSMQKLTSGQLHWLLDPEIHRGAAVWNPHSSFPERLKKLKEELEQQDRDLIEEIDESTELPTPLLANYDEVALLSRTPIPTNAQPYIRNFIETLIRDVSIQTNLKFQLPRPLFANNDFRLETFIPHHRIDLSSIAYNDDSMRTRLTLAQDQEAFSNLKQTGIYKRGDYHITFSWYPGRDKIKHWRLEAWAEWLYQWSVQIPSVIVGRDRSILLGMWQFVEGVGITANRLTGLVPTWFPKYSRNEIEDECAKAYFQWLQDSEGFTVTATEVIKTGFKHMHQSFAPPFERYPVIFVHPTRGSLDFRTSVPKIRQQLRSILSQAQSAAAAKMGTQRMSIIASLSQTMSEEEAIEQFLDTWHDTYLEAIESRRHSIDSLSIFPDLTATVLKEEQARIIVGRVVKSKQMEREAAIETEMNTWKDAHPLKAASEKFLGQQRDAVTAKVEDDLPLFDGVQDALMEASQLGSILLLVQSQDMFKNSSVLESHKKALQAARRPGVVDIVFLKIPSRWTVKWHPSPSGQTYYELDFCHRVKIRSSIPLWRWQTVVARYFSWIWNSSFCLMNKASIALRRWNLLCSEFEIRLPKVNPTTGEFLTTPIRTLRGRLAALLEWKENIIQKARSGEHIIRLREGVYLDTCWAHFWTTVGAALGGASLVVYTVVETSAVVAGASIALVTSPIWSLIGNIGLLLFNALVYDTDLDAGEKSKGPLQRNLFGIPNMLISTVCGAYHMFKGAAVAIGGEACHIWNQTWHGLMTLLLKRAEVPTRAEGFFWSTSGPGMKTPFVLIDTDTAILALLAYLSSQELTAARQEMHSELGEPRRTLEKRTQDDSANTLRLSDIRVVSNSLAESEKQHRIDLSRFQSLSTAERRYQELLHGVQGNSQIRMEAAALESFYFLAIPITKKFYLERYFPRLASFEIIKFWETRDLAPGDWQGLMSQIMSETFTSELIVPFEAASDDLVVNANQVSGLAQIIQEALEEQGVVTGESTEYSIGHPIRSKKISHAPDYHDLPIYFEPKSSASIAESQ